MQLEIGSSTLPSSTMNVKCPKCNFIVWDITIKDKVEICCDFCSFVYSVDAKGVWTESFYNSKEFVLCSDQHRVRGGPGTKPGQFR